MYYLYGTRSGTNDATLVATFGSEQQLLAYVGWATLRVDEDGSRKFEQGSALAGFSMFHHARVPLTEEDETAVFHNPTPTML